MRDGHHCHLRVVFEKGEPICEGALANVVVYPSKSTRYFVLLYFPIQKSFNVVDVEAWT